MISKIKAFIESVSYWYIYEFNKIIKDSGALLIFVLGMLAYPVIYSTGYQREVLRDIPVAVVDLDQTQSSRLLTRMFDAAQQTRVVATTAAMSDAREAFQSGEVEGILCIPQGFEKDIYKGKQADVSVYCDGAYFLYYKQVLASATYSVGTISASIEVKRLLASGVNLGMATQARNPVPTTISMLYNPIGGYGSYVMPGIIIVIIQQTLLVGIGMIGGSSSEKHYKNYLVPDNVSTKSIPSFLLGNAGAYMTLYFFNAIYALVWLYDWFSFPDKSGFLPVVVLLIPFVLAVTFFGIGIAFWFKKRENSILTMVFLSPIVFFLSGASWPVTSMPVALQWLAKLFPSTTMVPAYLRVRTMGASLNDVLPDLGVLWLEAFLGFGFAFFSFYLAQRHVVKKTVVEAKL